MKKKKLLYIQYQNENNLNRWVMSQTLPVNKFEWIKDTSQFNKDFIKSYYEERDEGYFLEIDFQYLKKLCNLHNYLPYLSERKKNFYENIF